MPGSLPLDDLPASGPRQAAASLRVDSQPQAVVSPKSAADLERVLTTTSAAVGYRPQVPILSVRSPESMLWEFWQDVEAMRRDASISLPLSFVMAALAHAEWTIEGSSIAVAEFAAKEIQWFWANAVGRIQEEAYPWGWCPAEMTYEERDGLLSQCRFDTFHPYDADPLIKDCVPIGIEIRNVEGGHKRLSAWREWPNKGFWYAHRSRHGQRKGQSQIRAAWRHWRRLTGRDGGEEIIDLGVYRNGVGDTVVRHPNQPYVSKAGRADPMQAAHGFTHTRDEARFVAENRKGGAGIAISSEVNSHGDPLWGIDVLDSKVAVDKLVTYVEYLERKCSKAVGVPPELFEAAQTGSGYSGRAIPLQGFLVSQQRPLDDLTREWCHQIGNPLVKWNWGPEAWVRITPTPLFESYRKAAWDGPQGGGPQQPPGMQPSGPPANGPPVDGMPLDEPDMLAADIEYMAIDY